MQTIINFLRRIWQAFIDFIEDVFLFFVDSVMKLFVFAVDGLGHLFSALDVTQYLVMLPPDVLNVMSLIGFGEAMGIIITAGTIRIMLQLIPFVRLGS